MRVVRGIKNALLNDVHELSAMLKTDQWHIRATYGNIRALQNDFGLTEPYPMQTISRNLPDEAATLAAARLALEAAVSQVSEAVLRQIAASGGAAQ